MRTINDILVVILLRLLNQVVATKQQSEADVVNDELQVEEQDE